MERKDMIFNKIAEELLIDYTSVYYVNIVTGEYQWYSADTEFHSLKIQQHGDDFFADLVRDADLVVHEDDKHIFMEDFKKEKLIAAMKNGSMQSIVYRLMIDGKPVYHKLRFIRRSDSDYFILGVINIDKEIRMEQESEKLKAERVVFDHISESLAMRYDLIWYVNSEDSTFQTHSRGVELSMIGDTRSKKIINQAQ